MATYRLQLHAGFTLDDAAALCPYLALLGVSHVYTSPVLQARSGSVHGYDVTDPSRINPELGGEEGFARFTAALEASGLLHLADIVPNHMAASHENPWWWDVLKNGRASSHAEFFDIDWEAGGAPWAGKVVLPVLAEPLGEAVADGHLRVDGEILRYRDALSFPLAAAPADPPESLWDLLAGQHYRLAHWQVGNEEINYRRFFDLAELAGIRAEREEVFSRTHERLTKMGPSLAGLRIDHPDGLRDPGGYLARLREAFPHAWILVEKILEPGESLPASWAVQGTTGYDFLNRAMGVMVDPAGEGEIDSFYRLLVGRSDPYREVVAKKKRLVVERKFRAEVGRLARGLRRICYRHAAVCDVTEAAIREALEALLIAFPVYRTYVTPGRQPRDEDLQIIAGAVREAGLAGHLGPPLDTFIEDLLGGQVAGADEADFVLRFQQLTGPVMAKGVEDTAFYCYDRFVAINEVGGDPGRFGLTVAEFHEASTTAARDWPATLLATTTHDTKRSEDTRARLCLLSEIAPQWTAGVQRWTGMNAGHWGGRAPDHDAEYLLYQTLVGTWPITPDRLHSYFTKARREAKRETSWSDPDAAYEEWLRQFIDGVLGNGAFVADFRAFLDPLVEPARASSLAQTLVKLTAPGVPHIYQGCELWAHTLVDPDNRQPVDFASRESLLAEVAALDAPPAVDGGGAAKLFLIARALGLRRRRPDAFGPGSTYRPLAFAGQKLKHAIGYLRGDRRPVAVVVPRLVLGLGGDWGDTVVELPEGRWRCALSGRRSGGGRVPVADLAAAFPVILLENQDTNHA
ncbi:malto-oligosyltrehalose synthase [soil metagenome]